jgi:opacity protein-like surface antigen
MRLAKTLIAALLCMGAAPAFGQTDGYGYAYQPDGDSGLSSFAGLRGSLAFSSGANSHVPTAPPTSLRASYNTGGGGSVYIGTRLPYGLRLEAEALYRDLPLQTATLGGTVTPAHGYASIAAPMANLFWDLPVPDFPFRPFIGAGIGAAYTSSDLRDPTNANTYLTSHKWAPAYQFMGGAEVPLSQSSRFTAMYRWLQIDGTPDSCGVSGAATMACRSNLNTQSIDLGLEMDL